MSSPFLFRHCEYGNQQLPPIVFLHGFLGNCYDWSDVAAHLSNTFRCICVDLPGHGRTEVRRSDDNYRMERVAEGLIAFLDSIDIPKCYLVGYSMGGRLTLYMAVHFPRQFRRVVLESASPGLRSEEERIDRQKHDETLAERLLEIPLEQFIEEWFDHPLFATMKDYPDRLIELKEERSAADPTGLARSLRRMGTGVQPALWKMLNKIVSPALLIVGEKDRKFQRITREMAELMPTVETAVVKGAGHNVHWEKPEEYAAYILQFLGREIEVT